MGGDKTGIVDDFAHRDRKPNVVLPTISIGGYGTKFSIIVMLSGTWDAIAKFESQVHQLEERLHLSVITKRTQARTPQRESLPYRIDVVALDNPGIVHEIANFFASQHMNIESLETSTYAAPHTGSPMFCLKYDCKYSCKSTFRHATRKLYFVL
ncbi:MAG: glycine cleavage system protein R [Moraxellaceae bacterium]|nr:glycine cleavage system protein R [Moraxellaceae bacterium]